MHSFLVSQKFLQYVYSRLYFNLCKFKHAVKTAYIGPIIRKMFPHYIAFSILVQRGLLAVIIISYWWKILTGWLISSLCV